MKRTLSLILAMLLLASSVVSCGGNTTPNETDGGTAAVETNVSTAEPVATNAPETEAPTPAYSTNLVTENGAAASHIVLAEGAAQLEQYAAEELAYHIKKVSNAEVPIIIGDEALVSGADITVANAVQENSLPIIIGTPDTVPQLAELFPEDIAWLTTTLDENGRKWGDDGFAVRKTEDALYIFGVTPRGALNGVHDFIEDNMGVLWIRADESIGLIYDEMPTITIEKADYREKSPFQYRGTTFGNVSFEETEILYARNKLNLNSGYDSDKLNRTNGVWNVIDSKYLEHDLLGHTMKFWVRNSPIYDPNCTEYWNVDRAGNPDPNGVNQINFWSEKTLDTVIAAVRELLSQHPDLKTIPMAIEDGLLEKEHCYNPPYSEQPFEYAPGQFVSPDNDAYRSTVIFTFLNKVAESIAEDYPNAKIMTYAYHDAEIPPVCEIAPNVGVVYAPIDECMADPITEETNPHNSKIELLIERWAQAHNQLGVYEYYFCTFAMPDFERPLWYKMQADMQFYAENGFTHFISQGVADGGAKNKDAVHYFTGRTHSDIWAMNTLSEWMFAKLLWNPYEDVDALIEYFCDKVYGNASEYMKDYYDLLYKGWTEGESETYLWNFKLTIDYYLDTFVYVVDLENDIKTVLRNAYEAADTDVIKERIRYIKETFERHFPEEE